MKQLLLTMMIIYIMSSALTAQVSGLSGWNIFLDPGHSQKENMGIYNYSEAERNVRVGLRLMEYLLNNTDIDTVYISRTNDQQSVSLSQRTDYANSLGAAWFHSIHSDAGTPDNNSTLLLWGQYYNKKEKVPNGGKAMADIIVSLLTRGMRTNTRGSIGDCSFYTGSNYCAQSGGPYLHVNRESIMPSELSEAGFHTNPKQNQLFMNDDWKRLEANTYYWSILKFHNIPRPPVGICTGIIYDKESRVPINGAHVTMADQTYITNTFESLFNKYTGDPDLLHNGFYYIDNLPNTTLSMIVQAPDYYGDTLQVSMVDSFFTFRDVELVSMIPPRVIFSKPAQRDSNVAAWESITIDFSRKVNRTSLLSNLTIAPEIDRTIIWSNNDTRITIKSDTLKYLTDYTITIPAAVTDAYGHPFDGDGNGIGGDDFILSFSTGSQDRTPPVIVAFHPAQGVTDVDPMSIVSISFDERIRPSTVDAETFKFRKVIGQVDVKGTIRHYEINNRSVVCFFPYEPLQLNESYIVRIFSGIRDVFGNEMTTIKSFSFKITATAYEVTKIDNFETALTDNWWNPQQSGSTLGILTELTNRSANRDIVNLITSSTQSLQLNYGWDLSSGTWLVRIYLDDSAIPKTVRFDKNYILQAYVFGDGSGNQFRFALDDRVPTVAASNHEVSPWYTLDWIGWKLISWNLSVDGTGTWIGDGNLDGALRIDSIQLTYASGGAQTGTIYMDDLRLIKSMAVDVEDEPVTAIPEVFQLFQNYPNPFNPSTTIQYQLTGIDQPVKLVIYDLLGQSIATLVNERQSTGIYSVQWDAGNERVASGIYFYYLTVGELTQGRRMLLIR